MEENKNINTNTENPVPENNDKPEGEKPAETKRPGFVKRGANKAKGVAKLVAPVAAKLAVIGGAAGAAAVAVIHCVNGNTDELVSRLDEIKDVVTDKGQEMVDTVKDSIE